MSALLFAGNCPSRFVPKFSKHFLSQFMCQLTQSQGLYTNFVWGCASCSHTLSQCIYCPSSCTSSYMPIHLLLRNFVSPTLSVPNMAFSALFHPQPIHVALFHPQPIHTTLFHLQPNLVALLHLQPILNLRNSHIWTYNYWFSLICPQNYACAVLVHCICFTSYVLKHELTGLWLKP